MPYVHGIAAGPPITIEDYTSEAVRVPSRLLKKGERPGRLNDGGGHP